MKYEAKKIILKDGNEAVLRSPEVEDAEKLLNFIIKASGESDFLLRYPEEWNMTVEQEANWIRNSVESDAVTVIACFIDGEAAGNCEIRFYGGMKMAHRAVLGISILKKYWNLGIGSYMFEALIEEAKKHGTEIMELEFIEGNERAKHLYEKFGFKVVAEKPDAFKYKDGTYRKEFYMQKDLRK